MPELPETSALLQVHPACVSVDKKRDAKYLEVLVLPSYQCCESQQLHLQFRLYRLINRVTRCVCSALTKYLFYLASMEWCFLHMADTKYDLMIIGQ